MGSERSCGRMRHRGEGIIYDTWPRKRKHHENSQSGDMGYRIL